MTAEKRNGAVVVTLILSMTIGARLLLWLEPQVPRGGPTDIRLTAERSTPVQEVEIMYAASPAEAKTLDQAPDSYCVIDPAGNLANTETRGPRWRLVVVGSGADKLGDRQKYQLLATLGSLVNRAEPVPVRLAPESDPQRRPDAPAPTTDLRELLVRKKFIE